MKFQTGVLREQFLARGRQLSRINPRIARTTVFFSVSNHHQPVILCDQPTEEIRSGISPKFLDILSKENIRF